jgi:hypothetical protein
MKQLISLISLLLLASVASAQNMAVTVNTNGVLSVNANGRSTNFFKTNMATLREALRNELLRDVTASNAFIKASSSTDLVLSNSTGSLLSPSIFNRGAVGPVVITNSNAGEENWLVLDQADAGEFMNIAFNFAGVHTWSIGASSSGFYIGTPTGSNVVQMTASGLALGDGRPVLVSGNLEPTSARFTNVVGSNYLSGRFASLAGTYSSLVNGNNAAIPTGTNSVLELSGGTTISQIAGFAATGEGDEFEARFSGAVTNWIVNEANSAFSTDATAANRIKTGTGGDITLTNQPSWARFRYRSSRWELKQWSR